VGDLAPPLLKSPPAPPPGGSHGQLAGDDRAACRTSGALRRLPTAKTLSFGSLLPVCAALQPEPAATEAEAARALRKEPPPSVPAGQAGGEVALTGCTAGERGAGGSAGERGAGGSAASAGSPAVALAVTGKGAWGPAAMSSPDSTWGQGAVWLAARRVGGAMKGQQAAAHATAAIALCYYRFLAKETRDSCTSLQGVKAPPLTI
jgi:hypothetical protein